MESLKFEKIFNRATIEKLAQILEEGGATNIQIDEGYMPGLTFLYGGIIFDGWVCYGNCTVKICPVDDVTRNSQFNTLKVNTLFDKLDKIVQNGYERYIN